MSPAVDAALDDAIAHCRAFNEQLMARAADWSFEPEPGLRVGEKITPIASVGLFVPSGKASYPSVAYQLGVPGDVAGVPRDRPRRAARARRRRRGRSGRARRVPQARASTDVFRVNGPAGIAALGFGTETIPRSARSSAPARRPSRAPRSRCSATASPR